MKKKNFRFNKQNLIITAFMAIALCACAQNVRQNSGSEYKDTVRDAAAQTAEKAGNAIAAAAEASLSESDGAAQKKYCSSIRKFKVMSIGDDYIIAAECSAMLPEKVCVIPKAQYVYFKKSQAGKIGVDIIYDGLVFAVPEKKCVKFTGTYKYKTKLDKVSEFISGDKSETTIPKAEIASRY